MLDGRAMHLFIYPFSLYKRFPSSFHPGRNAWIEWGIMQTFFRIVDRIDWVSYTSRYKSASSISISPLVCLGRHLCLNFIKEWRYFQNIEINQFLARALSSHIFCLVLTHYIVLIMIGRNR